MAKEKNDGHRPGPFKQTNKEHKHGRHRSKGSISIATKGKISVKSLSRKNKYDLNRDQRRNKANQIRQNKREEVLTKKRSLGGLEYAPFLIAVIPLNKEIDSATAIGILEQCNDDAVVTKSASGIIHLCIPRFKQRFSFVVPAKDNELAILDTLKVADSVLFLVSAMDGADCIDNVIDNWGNKILTSAFAQGIPTPTVAITDLVSIAPKKRHDCKQRIQKLVNKWLPEEKVMLLDTSAEGINILRRIGNQKRKSVLYRDRRPHLIGERVEYCADKEGATGTLKVTGYLRGTPLSVNQLIHIPGLGDFQMSQIDLENDPNKFQNTSNEDEDVRVLERCDETKQESLESENTPDPMDAEQTWPNSDDYEMAEKDREQAKLKKRVPKGWSDYQAAWIPEDDAEFQNDQESSDDEEEDGMDAESDVDSEGNNEQCKDNDDAMTESEVGINDDRYDQEIDMYTEKEDLEKLKAAKSDLMFPDELDTPIDTPARVRFLKYRGLESFRTSPWDPKENLSSDYARIFRFVNFDRIRKRIVKEQVDKEDGALVSWYITVHVKNVSQLLWNAFKSAESPLVLIGLFPYEHKMSVVNTVLKRTTLYDQPIKSKERLIFQCGYRRFIVNPVFSQHTNGQKHKFERFFQSNATAVASFYAPIQFPPAPVLCYKEMDGNLVLVATGNLLSCNPDRLVIKRVVLSGHPFKIYKRSAVIRFMFFNRDDIEYFKSCKLRTKMGRIGHIKEALGTHGHMKCTFDGQLKSQDTVLLNLYKRVFPKWKYEELIVSCDSENTMET